MPQVVTITEWKNKELVASLKEMLRLAESGELTGLAFGVKLGERHHGIGLLGDYAVDMAPVLAVTDRLWYLVQRQLDLRMDETPSSQFAA